MFVFLLKPHLIRYHFMRSHHSSITTTYGRCSAFGLGVIMFMLMFDSKTVVFFPSVVFQAGSLSGILIPESC